MVPLYSSKITRVPLYSRKLISITSKGLSPALVSFSKLFKLTYQLCWPIPLSLATTYGISLISFPPLTEMFHFSGCPDAMLCIHMTSTMIGRVSPFGNPRISACLSLPVAYRNLLRPSSTSGAKAFTSCP